MTKRYLTIGLDDQQYNELEYISNSIGKTINRGAETAVDLFLLYLKNAAIQVYFKDNTEFDEKAAAIFRELYKVDVKEAKPEIR